MPERMTCHASSGVLLSTVPVNTALGITHQLAEMHAKSGLSCGQKAFARRQVSAEQAHAETLGSQSEIRSSPHVSKTFQGYSRRLSKDLWSDVRSPR